MILPLERLEKKRPDATPGLHPVRSQVERAEEPERSQPVLCRETGNPPAVARAETVQVSPQVRVTPGDENPVERKAKVILEPGTSDKPADDHTEVDEDYEHTRDELVMTRDNGRPEPTGSVRPAHQYISPTESFDRIQRVESDKRAKEVGVSESENMILSPASDEGNIAPVSSGGRDELGIWDVDEESSEDSETEESDDDKESSEGDSESEESDSSERYIGTKGSDGDEGSSETGDDTEGSDDGEEYLENDDGNGSETASDALSPAPQRSQYFQGTPRRASARLRELAKNSPKDPSKATTPKRKTAPSGFPSDKGMKQRKRVKRVIEESDDYYEGEDKEDGREKAADRCVPHNVNRPAKILAQGQKLSSLQGRPPSSRGRYPWAKEEDETLLKLREEGKTWKYIAECVLGRSERAVSCRWSSLRKVALNPVDARTGRDRKLLNSSVVSSMARRRRPLPPKQHGHIWTKEEEETLFRLHQQGKSWKFIGECVLGRTKNGAKNHWCRLRTVALRPIEAQIGRRRQPHNSSVVSLMAKTLKLDEKPTWSKEQDEKLFSLRSQGIPLIHISRLIEGKAYRAVHKRWHTIKNRYPQVVPDPEKSESGKKGIPSIRQKTSHFSLPSECDGEEKEAEWNVKPDSHSAMVERESSKSSTNGDPPIDADFDTLSAIHPYHTTSKGTKSNATLTKDHDQRIPKLVASGNNALPYTKTSVRTEGRKELSHEEQRMLEAVREDERHLHP